MTEAAPGAPAAPPSAAVVFGVRLPVLQAYADLLAGAGVERGLLGPRETPRLWERHLLNCAGLADLLDPGQMVADLGAGAGLPGLVLAAARPDLHVVLVEPLLRRAEFLTEAVAQLGLSQVVVRRARAEELVGDLAADAVVARAVAPLDRLTGWALPLLRPQGRLLALKGERAEAELSEHARAITRLGGTGARVVTVGVDHLATWARVVVIERGTLPGGSSGTARTKQGTTRSSPTRTRRAPGDGPAGRRAPRADRGTSAAGPAAASTAGSPASRGKPGTTSARTTPTTPATTPATTRRTSREARLRSDTPPRPSEGSPPRSAA